MIFVPITPLAVVRERTFIPRLDNAPLDTHCKRGHPLSGDNLWISPSGHKRQCKACRYVKGRRGPDRRTKCRRGHPMAENNIYIDARGTRECLTCRRMRAAIHSQRLKELRRVNRANQERGNAPGSRQEAERSYNSSRHPNGSQERAARSKTGQFCANGQKTFQAARG